MNKSIEVVVQAGQQESRRLTYEERGWRPVAAAIAVPTEGGLGDEFEDNVALQQLMQKLPANQRVVFELRAQGLSYQQIARRLDCSPHTVDKALFRVKERLAGTVKWELR